MALQHFNTTHFTVLETRGLPTTAAYIVARYRGQEAKVCKLDKGKVVEESTGSIMAAFDCAEAVWLHIYDSGYVVDDVMGSCMILMPMFDLNLRPFEGWLPFVNQEGALVGRVAVQIYGDHTRKVLVSVMRGLCSHEEGEKLGGAEEPYVVMKVRDSVFKTASKANSSTPVWDETFEVMIGFRDKVQIQVLDNKAKEGDKAGEQTGGSEVLGIDMVTRVGQYMWIPILNDDGANAGKVLIQMSEGKMPERFPVRLLQAYGLATKHIKDNKTHDLFVQLDMGKQTFKSTAKKNASDPLWDEEFLLDVFPYESLHLIVKDLDWLQDVPLGEAYIPAKELYEHRGEQVWVDLNNTQGFNEGKLLLWVCPPPGSVYPDTLANRRIVLEVPTSPLAIMDDSSTYKPVFKGQFKPINTTEALPVASQPAADVPGKTSEPPTSGRASQSSAAATAHTYGAGAPQRSTSPATAGTTTSVPPKASAALMTYTSGSTASAYTSATAPSTYTGAAAPPSGAATPATYTGAVSATKAGSAAPATYTAAAGASSQTPKTYTTVSRVAPNTYIPPKAATPAAPTTYTTPQATLV
jgi:hypothetical protein